MPRFTNTQLTALNDHLRLVETLAQAMGLEPLTPDGSPGPLHHIKQVHGEVLRRAASPENPFSPREHLIDALDAGLVQYIITEAVEGHEEPPAHPASSPAQFDILDSESPSSL